MTAPGDLRSQVITEAVVNVTAKQLEDGLWFADSGDTPGCWGDGTTEQAALDEFCSVYREWVSL